jgi:hypothetical protein
MRAPPPLYQALCRRLRAATPDPQTLPDASLQRLALLATGIMLARSCVLRRVAQALDLHGLTGARWAASIERRLRRTLNDPHLTVGRYQAALAATVDWRSLRRRQRGGGGLVLAIDDSSQADRVHLLRLVLPYWGGSLPLAWAVWPQNVRQPTGQYWAALERLLDQVAALLPRGVPVVLTGDRFFDIPPFVDRVQARGWHWAVRLKAQSDLHVRDHQGRAQPLRPLLQRHLPGPGRRWKMRGQVFKRAGWRAASVVAVWGPGQREPLVVLTDLPPRWAVLRVYDRRFWIEPGFRADKAAGWQWEASQVQNLAHQQRLLLGMAWATLLTLCLGQHQAQAQLADQAARPAAGRRPPKPQPPRDSLFRLGLQAALRLLLHAQAWPGPWRLTDLDRPSWHATWTAAMAYRFIFAQPVRP